MILREDFVDLTRCGALGLTEVHGSSRVHTLWGACVLRMLMGPKPLCPALR